MLPVSSITKMEMTSGYQSNFLKSFFAIEENFVLFKQFFCLFNNLPSMFSIVDKTRMFYP